MEVRFYFLSFSSFSDVYILWLGKLHRKVFFIIVVLFPSSTSYDIELRGHSNCPADVRCEAAS